MNAGGYPCTQRVEVTPIQDRRAHPTNVVTKALDFRDYNTRLTNAENKDSGFCKCGVVLRKYIVKEKRLGFEKLIDLMIYEKSTF